MQGVVKTVLGLGHFFLQVLLVALQFGKAETFIPLVQGGRGGAGEEGAVDVFDLVVGADTARQCGSPLES